jgi:hypothetical protein
LSKQSSNVLLFCPLLFQQRGRHEKTTESAIGIIPGNRGKADDNWCRSPLCGASCNRQISPVPLDGVAADPVMRQRSCAVRRELRNRVQTESGSRPVSGRELMQLPRGLRLLLYDQDAAQCSGGSTPPEGPASTGGARKGQGAARSGRVWQSSQNLLIWGGAKIASPNCKSNAT